MSLPYLMVLMATIGLGPTLLMEIYLPAKDWETQQIAVDNAATVMAKGDRELFNELIAFNKTMKILDSAHDGFHLCKNSPPPAGPACKSADALAEVKIRAAHTLALNAARAKWLANTAAGLRELGKLETNFIQWERSELAPIHSEICKVCGLQTTIEIDKAPVVTFIRADSKVPIGVLSEVGGKTLNGSSKWNYKLKTGEERL